MGQGCVNIWNKGGIRKNGSESEMMAELLCMYKLGHQEWQLQFLVEFLGNMLFSWGPPSLRPHPSSP